MKKMIVVTIGKILLILLSSGIIPIVTESLAKEIVVSDSRDVQERIISIGKNENQVMEHLEHLTHEIGPRTNGSENLQSACEWARHQFEGFGLSGAHLERCAEVTMAKNCCPKDKPLEAFLFRIGSLFKQLMAALGFYHESGGDRNPLYNVVADIPGSEKPDEYVIITAHIDTHEDASGVSDNGTGVASVMEAARILMESGAKPRRTIRFVLFSGEEIGLHGSRGFVSDHRYLLPKISAMLNMDRGAHPISGIHATKAMLGDFEEVLAPVVSLNPQMPFRIERVDHLPLRMSDCCESGGASDQAAFLVAGVPALCWLQKGDDLTHSHLHSKMDTLNKIDPENIKHSATVIALAALGIADLNHMISRENLIDKDSLKVTHDACCGYKFSDPA